MSNRARHHFRDKRRAAKRAKRASQAAAEAFHNPMDSAAMVEQRLSQFGYQSTLHIMTSGHSRAIRVYKDGTPRALQSPGNRNWNSYGPFRLWK